MSQISIFWIPVLFFPAYLGIAWLAGNLLEIQDLFRRSTVYAILAVALSAPYFLSMYPLWIFFHDGYATLYSIELALGALIFGWAFQFSVLRSGMNDTNGCLSSIVVGFLSACVLIGISSFVFAP